MSGATVLRSLLTAVLPIFGNQWLGGVDKVEGGRARAASIDALGDDHCSSEYPTWIELDDQRIVQRLTEQSATIHDEYIQLTLNAEHKQFSERPIFTLLRPQISYGAIQRPC